ncbi:hypothetical protein ISCGN_014187 [Ixodes scapularis]
MHPPERVRIFIHFFFLSCNERIFNFWLRKSRIASNLVSHQANFLLPPSSQAKSRKAKPSHSRNGCKCVVVEVVNCETEQHAHLTKLGPKNCPAPDILRLSDALMSTNTPSSVVCFRTNCESGEALERSRCSPC